MKLVCAQSNADHSSLKADLHVDLYESKAQNGRARTGSAIKERVRIRKLEPAQRSWDLLSIALSVIAADLAGHRSKSPDGWTREFELVVAVSDPQFWITQTERIQSLLGFLTTDV